MSLFVNPAQFDEPTDLDAYPRDEARDLEIAEAEGVDVGLRAGRRRALPAGFATWVEPDDTGAEGAARPGHFRGVATVCLKLFNVVRPGARVLRPEGRAAGRRDPAPRPRPERAGGDPRRADRARPRRARALVPQRPPLGRGARARARPAAALRDGRGEPDPVAAARASLNGLDPEYVEVLDLGDAKVLAAAVRVGSTRLIDNVLLEGELT